MKRKNKTSFLHQHKRRYRATRKKTITIPEDLLAQAKEASDNFSSLVTQALKEYLRKEAVKKAIDSFGLWEAREESSIKIVNKLRADKRGYSKRHLIKANTTLRSLQSLLYSIYSAILLSSLILDWNQTKQRAHE